MKLLFNIFFFLFFFNFSNAQTISGVIFDSITKQPLDLVNVTIKNTDIGVYTKSDGKFKLKSNNASGSYLLISHLGYKTKIISLLNLTAKKNYENIFYLSPTVAELKEVIIQNKKVNYSWNKVIKSKRDNTKCFGFQFGTENCTYIKNLDGKAGKIKEVILDLKKTAEFNKKIPAWKLDYIATYNIRFYKFDISTNNPGEQLYEKDIIVEPKNKNYSLKIDVDSLHISFPVEGVCVGVEVINTKYINPKKVFAIIGPNLNFTENREMHPIMAWTRFRNNGEREFKSSLSVDRKGRKYNMMIVDLVIQSEKK